MSNTVYTLEMQVCKQTDHLCFDAMLLVCTRRAKGVV